MQFAKDIVTGYNKKYTSDIPPYDPIGSGGGIRGFLNKTYKVGASDDPLNNIQDAQANAAGGKFTLPFTLTHYNLMTKKSKGLKLSAKQVASIYKKGGITAWSSIKSGLSGSIVPVARGDSSGTTAVISTWIAKTEPWISPATASWSTNTAGFFKTNIVYGAGTSGVLSAINGNSNAIGYVQTGAGSKIGLNPVNIRNPAGVFVSPLAADPTQSIPRTLPASSGNWNGVDLLNKSGRNTYPIVSFVYTFVFKKAGSKARVFLTYVQSSPAQNLVNTKYDKTLFRLPASLTRKNLAAIKTIK